jgi:NAD(P)-dependent dehydrogenase (short-subunit alcohol dehydrogenase family)
VTRGKYDQEFGHGTTEADSSDHWYEITHLFYAVGLAFSYHTFVAGSNGGIGYWTASLLAQSPEKYHIIVSGRSLKKVEDAVSSLSKSANTEGIFSAVELDITSDTSISNAFDEIKSKHGRLDVLINNAAVFPQNIPSKRELWQTTFTTNVFSTVAVTDMFIPLLLESNNDPRLIFLSSSLGSITITETWEPKHSLDISAYRASKAALNMYMVQKTKELGKHGIKVWAVDPGVNATNLAGGAERATAMGAKHPSKGAQDVVDIVEGRRDDCVGKNVWAEGVRPW